MKFSFEMIALIIILAATTQYFIISLTTPVVFGDEGYYASRARWIADNHLLPKTEPYYETDTYHQRFVKPPIYIMINTFGWLAAGELGIKLLLPVFSVLSAFIVYMLLKKMGHPRAGIAAAFSLTMVPSMVTYGVLNYVDTMLVMLVAAFMHFCYESFSSERRANAVVAGIFAGFAILTKITGGLVLLFAVLYFLSAKKTKYWKNLLIIIAIAAVVASPLIIRNMAMFGSPCYGPISGSSCGDYTDVTIPADPTAPNFTGDVQQTGTAQNLLSVGVLNYTRFAYGWTLPVFMLLGIGLLISRRKETDIFWAAAAVSFLPVIFMSANGRIEDLARFLLPLSLGIVALAGLFADEAYGYLKKNNKLVAAAFVLIFVATVWFYGQEKLDTMVSVKQFAPGFIEGCKWIKANTNEDSLLLSIYSHQTVYLCDRAALASGISDANIIRLTNDNRSYEHLKLHGFDYIFIQQFTVSQQALGETTTPAFINYLDTSPHFKKVYDNTDVYGSGGVTLYQVL